MKLATYLDRTASDAAPRIGVVREDDTLVDLVRARELGGPGPTDLPAAAFADMLALLRAGEPGMAAAHRPAEQAPDAAEVDKLGILRNRVVRA